MFEKKKNDKFQKLKFRIKIKRKKESMQFESNKIKGEKIENNKKKKGTIPKRI